MAQPLVEALQKKLTENCYPFHMPGHKQGRLLPLFLEPFQRLFAFDLTEIPGLDNLYRPEGPIKEAQEKAALTFGAAATFFLVNGATAGLQAAILASFCPGEKVALPRNCHRSILGALVLAGVEPVYVAGPYLPELALPLPPGEKEFTSLLNHCKKEISGVIAVDPDYLGISPPLREIGEKQIVDAAHGGHFPFHPSFPPHPGKKGALFWVHGAHKTLPVPTQAALLHLGDSRKKEDALRALSLVQTSSPSYLLMAALDGARALLEEKGEELYSELAERVHELKEFIRRLGLRCLEEEDLPPGYRLDWSRLYLVTADAGIWGTRAAAWLAEKGFQAEMANAGGVLFIFSPADSRENMGRLAAVLKEMMFSLEREKRPLPAPALPPVPSLSRPLFSLREVWFGPRHRLSLREATGKICASFVVPYPPGVPLLCPGEEITPQILDYLEYLQKEGIPVAGVEDNTIEVTG